MVQSLQVKWFKWFMTRITRCDQEKANQTLYSHWGNNPRGDLKPKGVFIFSSFPLLQTLKKIFWICNFLDHPNLHSQGAWELGLDVFVADQLASGKAVLALRAQLCHVLPLLWLGLGRRPPLPSSFSSCQDTGDQERQQDNLEPQHPEKWVMSDT